MPRKRKPAAIVNPKPAGRQVIEWMIEGQREADIAEAVAAQFPGTDAKVLIEQAVDHFVQAANCQRAVILGWSMEAYRDLYRKMLGAGDFQGAMRAVAALQKLAAELPADEDQDVHDKTTETRNDESRTGS